MQQKEYFTHDDKGRKLADTSSQKQIEPSDALAELNIVNKSLEDPIPQ